jgi:hypothetical protein
MAERPGSLQSAERAGYEPRDASIRGVLWVALAIVVAVALGMAVLAIVVRLLETANERPALSPLERTEVVPPEPRLEVHPARTLAEIRRREEGLLETFAWIDREAGIARIPIEEAMAVLAKQGWPDKEGSAQIQGSQP